MKMQSRQNGFLKGWLIHNFVGWMTGCLIIIASIPLFARIKDPYITGIQLERERMAIYISLVIWLPLSASVAVLQWLKLRYWNIHGVSWVLATTLACVLPNAILPSVLYGVHIPFFEYGDDGRHIVQLIIVALSVGGAQSVVLRGSRSMSALWIIACLAGSLALAFLAIFTDEMGYRLGNSLTRYYLSLGQIGRQIEYYRWELLFIGVLLIVPIWATLVIGLPTGLIFSRLGLKQPREELDVSRHPAAQ
jgi:hypothetical protein